MHVFCPDCKAEYRVRERSNSLIEVKFICYECKNSWTDSLQKEITKGNEKAEEISKNVTNDLLLGDIKDQTQLLSSLAMAEIDNSFGEKNSSEKKLEAKGESDTPFSFETSESSEEEAENGPTQNFPDLKRQSKPSEDENNTFVETRNNKEIEIEKRLKESTELLKKAREDTGSDTSLNLKQKKNKHPILYISGILVFLIFLANLVFIFEKEIFANLPFAEQLKIIIFNYSEIIYEFLRDIYSRALKVFITNLG